MSHNAIEKFENAIKKKEKQRIKKKQKNGGI